MTDLTIGQQTAADWGLTGEPTEAEAAARYLTERFDEIVERHVEPLTPETDEDEIVAAYYAVGQEMEPFLVEASAYGATESAALQALSNFAQMVITWQVEDTPTRIRRIRCL